MKSAMRLLGRSRSKRCPVRMLIASKRTHFAFLPLIDTGTVAPRGAHFARKGGKKRMSVSSSARMAVSGRKWLRIRRIRCFFLFLGVFFQHVARSLPNVAHGVQFALDGALPNPLPRLVVNPFQQKWDGPL